MCHMVPRPVYFTWQCAMRYHNQCLSPGNVACGTTTSGLLQRFCSILCRSKIKMATISRGYVNLLPPWYFKITLSYIMHALVLYTRIMAVYRKISLSWSTNRNKGIWPFSQNLSNWIYNFVIIICFNHSEITI
jgi:hypothetical protein